MHKSNYSTSDIDELIKEFNTDKDKGLSKEEVGLKLKEFGLNTVDTAAEKWFNILLRQFKSPFIYLLFFAGILALLVGEKLDALMISLFIIINTILGFTQEYKSENTLRLLKSYITSSSRVLRGGKVVNIKTEEIVPGDILFLEIGDRVSADMRIIESNSLVVDESVLTGESIPINKIDTPIPAGETDTLTEDNMLYSGTTILDGTAKGLVVLTGSNSRFGQISKLTLETPKVSSFEKTLAKFSKYILWIVSITVALIVIINLLLKSSTTDIPTLLIFSIALAIAVIPQALPLVMTFSLSRGAGILAKKKVAVKRLSSIEELGGLNVLCTDKTGTITENILEVRDCYTKNKEKLLIYANLASSLPDGQSIESFDVAVWNAISDKEKETLKGYKRLEYIPFNPKYRRNGVRVEFKEEELLIFRGAVEAILKKCQIDNQYKKDILEWVSQKESEGMRCLAIASKIIKDKNEDNGFTIQGIIAFEDPVKESTYYAVKRAEELGINLKIITGDSKRVAVSVGKDIGIIDSSHEVITGFDFDDLNYDQKKEKVFSKKIFARFTPEQKFEVVEILKQKYRTGFLGDGINDAPALKSANVSLAVSNSVDIAREAADIILLERDLKVIVDGIYEGRKVFENTVKYLKLTLSANFGNFYAIAIASFFIDFLPMLPLQILLLNLLSDFPMIAVATDTVDDEALRKPKKYEVKEMFVISTILGLVSTFFDFVFFFVFVPISPTILQTSWFIGSVLTELVFLFSIRTKVFFLKAIRPSTLLIVLSLLAGVLTLLIPNTEFGQTVFGFESLSLNYLGIILLIVALYFATSEIVKVFLYKNRNT